MRRVLLLLVACFGCRQVFGLESPLLDLDAASTGDDAPDLPQTVCLGTGNFTVCVSSTVPATYDVTTDTQIATDTCDIVDNAHADWCIVAAHDVRVDAKLRATGSKPLVLVALHDLTVGPQGLIDVASGSGPNGTTAQGGPGAGAYSASCGTATEGSPSINGGGGGAGGTFGTKGGAGGKGDAGTINGGTPAAVDPSTQLTANLRGGCAGTSGGSGGGGATSAPGGAGGGAVYLAVGNVLDISGTLNASGAGGGGGVTSKGGGGGGGSGGMIALWAGSITLTATSPMQGSIFANGGGGGGGADNGAGGQPGATPTSFAAGGAGGLGGGVSTCGSGPGCGGTGGAGDVGGQNGVADQTVAGGGGGGGGGGVVHVVSGQTLSGSISPLPR